jgi:hypothetical protein
MHSMIDYVYGYLFSDVCFFSSDEKEEDKYLKSLDPLPVCPREPKPHYSLRAGKQ